MSLNIIVCIKQLIDPETPIENLTIDADSKDIGTVDHKELITNGFDLNAVEAALYLKDRHGAKVTVISLGTMESQNSLKRPLAMGADEAILINKPNTPIDSATTALLLSKTISLHIPFDLILCGRQASDWDNAEIPFRIAENLNISCISLVSKIEINESKLIATRALPNGLQKAKTNLPGLITITNEFGEPRYPSLRGIMSANKKNIKQITPTFLGINESDITTKTETIRINFQTRKKNCEFIKNENNEYAAQALTEKLKNLNLI